MSRALRSRTFRPIAVLLSFLLLVNTPVQAGPVVLNEVIQIIGGNQNPSQLRLRSFQTGNTPTGGAYGSVRTGLDLRQSLSDGPVAISDTSVASRGDGSNSLLSGIGTTDDPPPTVQVITQGDVEGTICDCGEILAIGGGVPKWPLLFLAAIPLFFIHHDKDIPPPTFTPTPTPTPTLTPTVPVPEPASLLLFGSGLLAMGANLRRRYGQLKLVSQADTTEGA